MLLHTGIDQIDRKILRELTTDARLTVAELGRRIGLSPSASAERLRRLESLEFIRGYRAEINLQALGFTITAFVRLTCEGTRYKPFLKFLPRSTPYKSATTLTGNDAFLLKVVLASMTELEDLIEKLLPYGSPPPAWSSLRHSRESVRFASRHKLFASSLRTTRQHKLDLLQPPVQVFAANHNGGAMRITVSCVSLHSTPRSRSASQIGRAGTFNSIASHSPRPRTSRTVSLRIFCSLASAYAPSSADRSASRSSTITRSAARATAHAKGFPPNVLP